MTYNPFVLVAFNIGGSSRDEGCTGEALPVDASAWGGICITYFAEAAPELEMGLGPEYESEENFAAPSRSLPKASANAVERCVPWSDFKQPSWYNGVNKMSGEEASRQLVSLKFKIQQTTSIGNFSIIRISRYNGW